VVGIRLIDAQQDLLAAGIRPVGIGGWDDE